MAYHRVHGLDTRIVRIFNTYGPRMRPRDGRVVPAFIQQALLGEPLTVFGDGAQTRSFCYVDDLIEGIWRLLRSGEHDPVNIGNPREMTILRVRRDHPRAGRARARRSSSASCRPTTPRRASPTSRARGRSWAGSRGSRSRKGLSRTIDYFRSLLAAA